jgi:hypothetical protein
MQQHHNSWCPHPELIAHWCHRPRSPVQLAHLRNPVQFAGLAMRSPAGVAWLLTIRGMVKLRMLAGIKSWILMIELKAL